MIKLENISKKYKTKTKDIIALDNINLDIKKGEIFSIIGKSGAGKSSLLRIINLLENPTSGNIFIENKNLNKLIKKDLKLARKNIGVVFQNFNLLEFRTVEENIALPLEINNVNKKNIDIKVKELINVTGLNNFSKSYPSQLSGGQKQRVGIARALATNPKILLCDEMTSALDQKTTDEILLLIKSINKKYNISVLLITHEMDVVKKISDQVAVLDRGKIIEQGRVLEVFSNPKTKLAKELTQSSMHIEIPENLKVENYSKNLDLKNYLVIFRIIFIGDSTKEPIIDSLCKKFDLNINIIQGNIEHIQNNIMGMMLLTALSDKFHDNKIKNYLETKGLQIEVIGYVRRDNFNI